MNVDVRVGVIAGDHRGVRDHARGKIGVHVQRDAGRQRRRDTADARQQFTLTVVEALRDHGTMQVEQEGVATASYRIAIFPAMVSNAGYAAAPSSGVATGEKVLVSCFIWAITIFIGLSRKVD